MERKWNVEELEKIAETNEFIKEAAELTNGLVKTAEDAEMFRQGLIFGMGQRIGMSKKAEGLSDQVVADAAVPSATPSNAQPVSTENVDPNAGTPTQVPTIEIDTGAQLVQELKALSDELLPGEFAAYVIQNGLEGIVQNNPELATKFEEGKAVLNSAQMNVNTATPTIEQTSVPAKATSDVPSAPGM